MVSHWSLSDRKSTQVSRTLSIRAVLNSAVVWMVSTRLPLSKSSSPFYNPSVTVPKAPITSDIILTFMFHNFSNSLARSRYLFFLFTFLQFYSVVSRDSKVHNFASSLFFLLIIIRSGLLVEIRLSVCIRKSHRGLCVLFLRTDAGLCIQCLLVWSNLNFLHNSQLISLSTQSCLVLYFFYANLLHSFI